MIEQSCAIKTRDLTRSFAGRPAVANLDLRVPQRGIYSFLGPNGSGKTTTIRMLLGLIRPDRGSVEIFGRPFSHDLLGRIGSLVEMPSLYSHLTGAENLEVTRRQLGVPATAIDRNLDIVGLRDDANRLVREYSLGMRQRLGLALALLGSPDLLILDEPTNGLDPAGIHEMRDLLRRLPTEHGVTVFLSSHLLAEVEQVAEFIGILHQGKMVFQGSLAELRRTENSRVRIAVRRSAEAVELLRQLRYDARADTADVVLVSAPADEANKINRLLIENGHDIFHLSVEHDTLEGIFLKLTGGQSQ
jgi:lantibiotic transport system ATP-binding protein